jgi:hypothetical protein
MEGCGASMSFVNTGSMTVILYLEASRNFCVFLQFSGLIWMAFGNGDLHIMFLNTEKFYENSALKAILFKGMNEIVPIFCTFSEIFCEHPQNLLIDFGFYEN